MSRSQFQLALMHLQPSSWRLMEDLASVFMAAEFTELRTLAAASGDGGRDGVLFQPVDDESIVLQYSVSKDFEKKVINTLDRLKTTVPKCAVLIYVTNQEIGPLADDLKRKTREERRIHLDIRDRSWLLDRQNMTPSTSIAADEFSSQVVDPMLSAGSGFDSKPQVLSSDEERVAVVYLTLQYEDEARDRGLTKLCFEALVRAALRATDNDHLMHRDTIRAAVRATLPSHPATTVDQYTDLALARLSKSHIRHWKKTDEYCLTHGERLRLAEGLAQLAILEEELGAELEDLTGAIANAMEIATLDRPALVIRVRRVLEHFLLERGEAFVRSLSTGQAVMFLSEEIEELVVTDLTKFPDESGLKGRIVQLVSTAVEELISRPGPVTHKYLAALGDGYTLFAFLRETPDVQGAVSKIFASGEIWLDTSAILPLLVEELLEPENRQYTATVAAAHHAGVKLRVTNGVLNEVHSHIANCRHCRRLGSEWRSRTPFLLGAYVLSGRPLDQFGAWSENFEGTSRPLDDIAEYLLEVAGIRVQDLGAEVDSADDALRIAVEEYWLDVHLSRGSKDNYERDPEKSRMLAGHDSENYLGVIRRRSRAGASSLFGYDAWWLTLDRAAYSAADSIQDSLGCGPINSPVLSFDFLVNYLSIGPARAQVAKGTEATLPLMTDISLLDGVPADLISIAEATRSEMDGQNERYIRRTVRDKLDKARWAHGELSASGAEGMERRLRSALAEGPKGSA